ncbi:GTP cyclohydrolase II [Candidatus Saccharibacteria bacterium]|nr:GTP cyclohydrolase II [Candidatus Saccharibacteria bacterium]
MHLALLYIKDYQPGQELHKDVSNMFHGADISPILRIHSECLLGDALYSDLCDCGEQLKASIQSIVDYGVGVVLYMRQEGRGIGFRAKLACLAAQEGYVDGIKCVENMTPDQANLFCGHKIDERSYEIVPNILDLLGINKTIMMTSNIDKIKAVEDAGIEIDYITDIDRGHIVKGSRKHRELSEKAARNYCLNRTDTL